MKEIMVIAPHPDDETLGCGGTLLHHKNTGDRIHWLIVTQLSELLGFSKENIELRHQEIQKVSERYEFESVHHLNFPTTQLETIPMKKWVEVLSSVFSLVKPEVIYLPYAYDVHSDHRIVFQAVSSSVKWFRSHFIRRILSYETLSETEFNLDPQGTFLPNVFVDIGPFLEKKIEIAKIYESEMGDFPFPRSLKAIESLAYFRGSMSGFRAAEAFMLLKERV